MNPPPDAFGPVVAALRFAAERHRDQRRKGDTAAPYVNHLIAVLDILWHTGQVRDPVVLTAGVLHDTIEDTDTEPTELVARFGPQVAAVVAEVTDDKRLPKERRKDLQIERAAGKSAAARHIKLADKISNVHDILHAPPSGWPPARQRQYVAWAAAVVDRIRGTNAALEEAFDALRHQADTRLC